MVFFVSSVEFRSPEMVALADWLVGPFTHGEQTQLGELQSWQVPFYDVAIGGLRRVSCIPDGEEFPDDFQPDPLKGVELYRELAYDRKMHGMVNGMLAYIADYKSGALTTKLYEDQQEIMDALAEAVTSIGTDEQINVKSPTGSGKTAILTTLVQAMKYKEQPNDKVRSLVLVHSKEVLNQTITAFDKFTDYKAARYFGEAREIGDVTVMTYQSFAKSLERGDVDQGSFDIVIRDEADTFSRGKIGNRVDTYCNDPRTARKKYTVGLTATPHEEQALVFERTILESIDGGRLAPLSTYQRHTNASVHEADDRTWREDFKDSEVGHLMEDTARNEVIVEEVLDGLASGRRVMLRCVPGQKLRHPEIIQDMLLKYSKVRIQHPFMGDVEYRRLRPAIIPGNMNLSRRNLLTTIFNNHLDDRIDALIFVGTLIRGFDSPVAKKVINGSPTRSPGLEEQLMGRGERWFQTHSGNIMDAQAVDLVDQTESGQVTFEDIINRDAPDGMRYKKGAIIGPGLADLRDPRSTPGSAFEPIPVEEIADALRLLRNNGLASIVTRNVVVTDPASIRGHVADEIIAAASLLSTAKPISLRQAQNNERVLLLNATQSLGVDAAKLMLVAHRMRVGLDVFYNVTDDTTAHYFSRRAFERLRAWHSSKRS